MTELDEKINKAVEEMEALGNLGKVALYQSFNYCECYR